MCTLVLMHRVVAGAPLVVLANRDEMLDRPSLGPRLVRREPAVFCGLDSKEGGTWCGINEHGLFVGLTNLTVRPPDSARRSRGLLCLDLLALRSFDALSREIQSLPSAAYNPFNLVVADATTAIRVRYVDAPHLEELASGVHATTNWPEASEGDAKRLWAQAEVANAVTTHHDLPSLLLALQQIARTHERGGDPRASICCHVPGYGTRSSTLIALPQAGGVIYQFSDGPPCEASFDDLSASASGLLGHGLRRPN